MEGSASRSPLPSRFFLTANEKDFSLSLEMTMRKDGILTPFPAKGRPEGDVRGMAAYSCGILPPSLGRRCPEGAEVGSQRNEKKWEEVFPRFVIPSAAEGSFSFPVSVFLRNAVCMKHCDPQLFGERCFPLSAPLTTFA